MRRVRIRFIFEPYVETITLIDLEGEADKATLLKSIKAATELTKNIGEYHALYLAISDMPEWLVGEVRFSVSHTIGPAHVFIQVDMEEYKRK